MKHAGLVYVLAYTALVAVFFGAFLVLYIVLRQLAPGTIVFYSGLRTIAYSLLLNLVLVAGLRAFLRGRFPAVAALVNTKLVFPAVVAYLLVSYSFVITIPALLDRSISIFIIATVAQSGPGGADVESIQRRFLAGYVGGTSTVEKRLEEQLASGDMTEDGGIYRITDRGRFVYSTNVFLARLFNINDRYVRARIPGERPDPDISRR